MTWDANTTFALVLIAFAAVVPLGAWLIGAIERGVERDKEREIQ